MMEVDEWATPEPMVSSPGTGVVAEVMLVLFVLMTIGLQTQPERWLSEVPAPEDGGSTDTSPPEVMAEIRVGQQLWWDGAPVGLDEVVERVSADQAVAIRSAVPLDPRLYFDLRARLGEAGVVYIERYPQVLE